MTWAAASAAALGLTGALALPIMAQSAEDREGNIPVAIDAINDPSFFAGAVQVDPDAPLAVFGGSGKQVAIDGRPIGMLEGAAEEPEGPGQPEESDEHASLLSAQVGELGVLPGDLQLMHPVTTRRITSPYGWRKNPTGPGNQIHIGQDYALACGSPVYAAEAGRVVVSGWHGHAGNRVTIDHGHNVQTGYSHNSKLLVKIGDEVEQGQVIALVGTTGNSTGCHLHFEVIVDGRWHDPRNYLPGISGQPNAMIDSRRLTVSSNSAPGGNGGGSSDGSSATPTPKPQDPDVVVPEDDTPVVPKPKPKPQPQKQPASPSPAEREPSASPSSPAPQSPKHSPSKPPRPTPTEPSGSPSPSGTSDETSVEPSESQSGSQSPAPSPSSQTPSPSETTTSSSSESAILSTESATAESSATGKELQSASSQASDSPMASETPTPSESIEVSGSPTTSPIAK